MTTLRPTNNISNDPLINHRMPTSVEVFGSPIVEETEARKSIAVALVFEENGTEKKIGYSGTYKLTRQRRAGTNEEVNSYKLELQLKISSPVDTDHPSELNKTMMLRAQPDGFIRISSIPLSPQAENEFKPYLDYFQANQDAELLSKGNQAFELAIKPSLKHSLFQVYAFERMKNRFSEDIKRIGADNYSQLAWKLKGDYACESHDPASVEGALVKYARNLKGHDRQQVAAAATTSPALRPVVPPEHHGNEPVAQPPERHGREPVMVGFTPPAPHPAADVPKKPVTQPAPRSPLQMAPATPPPPAPQPPARSVTNNEKKLAIPAQAAPIPSAPQPARPSQPAPRPLQVASVAPPPPIQPNRDDRKKAVKDKKLAAVARGVADLIRAQPAQPTQPTKPAKNIPDSRIRKVANDDEMEHRPSGLGFKREGSDGTSGGYGTIHSLGIASGDTAVVQSLGEKKKRFVAEMEGKHNIDDLAAADFAEDPELVEARENGQFQGVSAEDIEEDVKEQEREIKNALARLSDMKNKNIEELSAMTYRVGRLIDEWQYNKKCLAQYDKKAGQKYNSFKNQLEKISARRGL